MSRFEEQVVARGAEELRTSCLAAADWIDGRGTGLGRSTLELLQSELVRASRAAGEDATAAGHYPSRRVELLRAMEGSARDVFAKYDPTRSAERLVSAVQTSLAQTMLVQLSAVGISGAVALKAASLADLTGLLPAALLATSGFIILPIQRYRLQRELSARIDDLSAALNVVLKAHLEQELSGAVGRAREVVAPFATLVERSQRTNADKAAALAERRAEIEGLREAWGALDKGR